LVQSQRGQIVHEALNSNPSIAKKKNPKKTKTKTKQKKNHPFLGAWLN
jgi:hypothetical protein